MQKIISYLLISLIISNIIFVILGVLNYPLASIDAISIWLFKAKAFYLEDGFLPIDIFKNNLYLNIHPQYPVLIPFLFYIFYLALGGIKENIVLFINPLFYLLILFVVYVVFRKMQFSTRQSLVFTYIYSMLSPLLAQGGRKHAGDVDIFIVFINWLAVFLSFNFIKNRNYKILYALIILIMVSSQVKGEGLFLIFILFFLPLSIKTKIFYIAVSILPFLAWRGVIFYYKIPNDFHFLIPTTIEIITRTSDIIYYTLREMIKINNWYIFWPVFFIFIFFIKIKNTFINNIIKPLIFTYCVFIFIFYICLSVPPKIYVPPSIDRILLQLSPFYFLIFADLVKNSIFNNSKQQFHK